MCPGLELRPPPSSTESSDTGVRQALVLFETRFWKERGLESWLAASGIPALTGSFHPKLQPALACSHYSHLGTGLSPHGLGSPLLFI